METDKKTTTCTRCKKRFGLKNPPKYGHINSFYAVCPVVIKECETFTFTPLCPDCMDEFVEWLEPEREENNDCKQM